MGMDVDVDVDVDDARGTDATEPAATGEKGGEA